MKEIKCFTSYNNYFPQSYLEGSLTSDARGIGVNGETLKGIKKDIESDLLNLSEEMTNLDIRHNQRRDLISKIFKTLGYYDLDKAPDFNKDKELTIRGKKISIPVEGAFRFKGGDELWLLAHMPETAFSLIEDLSESTAEKKAEQFFDEPAMASFKQEPSPLPFRDIIDAIFDGDQTNCEFIIINSGDKLYLLERGKWQEGPQSYLELNLTELFTEINAKDYYTMAEALFSPKGFPIESAENFHETLERNAYKKATEVTKALRDTVRESIEIIADEILSQHERKPLSVWKGRDFKNTQDRQACADELFDQTLKYIYRMLFMLFTESQDQAKGALPVQSKAYQLGYSIEKLRDLETKPYLNAQSEQSKSTFIHETLNQAFKIYFGGYNKDTKKDSTNALGFSFPSLGTKLFAPESTPIFSEVRLPDSIMQTVVKKLSLAKTGKGKSAKTHRVHYAGLGLNQLGAVYEGLLTLKPEILGEKVVLLAKEDKDVAHRYAPFSQKSQLKDDQLAYDEDESPIVKDRGTFVLTPVGLERKFSASFYTPEVLTRFLAKEAVDTLLGDKPTLERMENLKILEPAMGSGAFLNAVVDEIAPRIAKFYEEPDRKAYESALAKLEKSGESKNPKKLEEIKDLKPKPTNYYVSKAKNLLMRNSVYGIDLNPTAVELAKISLWLNCLHEDGNLPFLDMKLRLGNSLVGAWVKRHQNKKTGLPHWFFPMSQSISTHLEGEILGEKKRPFIVNEALIEKLKSIGSEWDKIESNPDFIDSLQILNEKVTTLYKTHNKLKSEYEDKIENLSTSNEKEHAYIEYIAANTAYNQLRAMMDLWCALWFWPHDQLQQLPNAKEFVEALLWISETPLIYGHRQSEQLKLSGYNFLFTARKVALNSKFLHYDLEFSDVFETHGGFDIVLGNPPWAAVAWEESDFFELHSPGIHSLPGDAKQKIKRYSALLDLHPKLINEYKNGWVTSEGLSNFLKNSWTYPFRDQSQTNTYKYFYQKFYQTCNKSGIYAMIAQDGILTDQKCAEIRSSFLSETIRAFRFINELKLFEDIGNLTPFMVWISQKSREKIGWTLIDNLYHPETVSKCQQESEDSPYRGMKDELGNFELRGHPNRIVNINEDLLNKLGEFNDAKSLSDVRIPIIHGKVELEVLKRFAEHDTKLSCEEYEFWQRFHETGAARDGYISRDPGARKKIESAVLTGPNIYVANPTNKIPNPGCRNHRDFKEVDLASIDQAPDDYFPDTVFCLTKTGFNSSDYNSVTKWGVRHVDNYRIVGRFMVSTTGARTLSTSILPPGPTHTHGLSTLVFKDEDSMLKHSGLFHSILFDFLSRTTSGGNITPHVYQKFPSLTRDQRASPLMPYLTIRALRLNCISNHYSSLWEKNFSSSMNKTDIVSDFAPNHPYSKLSNKWFRDACIRDPHQREQALCEIDAIVALLFAFDKATLLNLYRSQFGVLQKNLQDLPGQVPDPEYYHFPRYEAMSKAYDHFAKLIGKFESTEQEKPKAKYKGAS